MLDWLLSEPFAWEPEFLLIPSLVAMAILLFCCLTLSNKSIPARYIIITCMVFISLRYMGWRMFDTLNFEQNLWVSLIGVYLIASELMTFFINNVSMWILYLYRTDRSPQADEYQKALLSGEFNPSVDIFIPTYNEATAILRRTVAGCQQMDYPNKNIYILDDGRRPEMRALAEEMGVGYFDRPDNKHFKAGNINNALFKTPNPSPYICFFDADFVPAPQFLTRTLGFFQNPKIAIVQTPLNFHNEDLIQCNLGLGSAMSSEQDMFFRGIQPGRDAFNAVICCGSCWVGRRDLLEGMGGVPTETITEDLMTSYRLQAMGYEVVYLNEALAFGEAANRSEDHLKQRTRWCRGILQTLFIKKNPVTTDGLNFWQRYFYIVAIFYWLTSLPRLILLLLPLFYFFLGWMPIKANIDTLLSYFLPFYITSMALVSWFNSGRRSSLWSDVYEFIPSFILIPNLVAAFVDPFGLGFKVTPKGVTTDKASVNWQVAIPCLVIIGLYAISIIYNLLNWGWQANSDALLLNLFWSVHCVILFWLALLSCVDVPQRREGLRFDLAFDYELQVGTARIKGKSKNISEQGLLVELNLDEKEQLLSSKQAPVESAAHRLRPAYLPLAQMPQKALVNPGYTQNHTKKKPSDAPLVGVIKLSGHPGLEALPVTLRFRQPSKRRAKMKGALLKKANLYIAFQPLTAKQYAYLVRALFSHLQAVWEKRLVPEWKAYWLFLSSAVRMYPLASSK